MPTYEYACEGCGDRYEKRESFSAPARQKCPKCGKRANRVLFAPPVVFKGTGFYSTDSRSSATSSSSDDGDGSTPSTPAPAAGDHGHSHGPGGHSHDTPDATEAAAAT